MNNDELISHASSIVLALSSAYFGAHGVDPTTLEGGLSAAIALASFGFKVYNHWNQKKVPETAQIK